MSTYRERKEMRAERLREWAAKRETDATAALNSHPEIRHDWAFITQPGRIPFREKMNASDDRAHASLVKAQGMAGRADGIEQQLATSIYSDDPDAIEALEAKVARLEAERDGVNARNAAYRKEHRAELKAMSAYERSQAVPFPPYHVQNLGGNITRTRKRLEQLKREATMKESGDRGYGRPMESRYAGSCPECGGTIEKGSAIVYYRLTREALHAGCVA